MTIKDILRTKGGKVITINEGTSALDAVKQMVAHRVGALVVTKSSKPGEPLGIFTERDVLRLAAANPDKLGRTPVNEVMTKDLLVGLPDDDVDSVLHLMTEKRMRHLPVMDKGEMIGIISIGDIVKARLSDTDFEARHMRDYIMGKV